MRLHFLGTGTSFGVPVLGCDCPTCTSADPRDHRTRHAALLEGDDGRRLLIDTPPELRLQLLRARIASIDAVWFTHAHADHTHGIDDLRAFSIHAEHPIDALAGPECAPLLLRKFPYIFDPDHHPIPGTSRPDIRLRTVRHREPTRAAGFDLLPLAVPHADQPSYGFRTGPLGYIADAKTIPPDVEEALRGVRVLVLNALWFGPPHPTHLTIPEAIEIARRIGARTTYLTHLTHRARHAELLAALPEHIRPAHDGLTLDL